jgi:hypothetical protein
VFQKPDLFLCSGEKEGCHKVRLISQKKIIAITGPDTGASPIFYLGTKTYHAIILLSCAHVEDLLHASLEGWFLFSAV